MKSLELSKAFTFIEPGPVVLITTSDGARANVMAISWTMVVDFSAQFAITTGAWNHSYAALVESGECVIAVPTIDLIDQVIGVGTVSGKAVDKFEKYGLTPVAAREVRAPLIRECLVNIECRVVDMDLQVIPGLYAAGEAVGGIHGACRLGSCATADCLVNGRIAGQNAAKEQSA